MNRRGFLTSVLAFGAAGVAGIARAAGPRVLTEAPFSISEVEAMARSMANAPYAMRAAVPQEWRDLSYDQYKSIWFNSSKAIWQDTDAALRLDLFHPGLYFPNPVDVHVVEAGTEKRLAFDFTLFDKTDKVPDLPLPSNMGYSGIRLRAELEKPEIYQEFAVFQGASYFRMIARHQFYGLSARGLAVNTAGPNGEEFPDFVKFWVERPGPGQSKFMVHALLDSPSVAGVYTFEIEPGDDTICDVRAVLYPRVELDNVGLGPLTSMFFFDQTNRNRFDDFRPAVHDSDGMAVLNGNGEALWRPLANPSKLQISSFVDENPRGFGLAQRARNYSDFADLEAHYHDRPSLWIEPNGDWGKGAVTLVEIPTDREIYDNIVAYWRPAEPIMAGSEYRFGYRMIWCNEIPARKPVARVTNTHMGKGFTDKKVVLVDFAPHDAMPEDLDDVVVHVSGNRGKINPGILQRNPETGGARLAFSFEPSDAQSIELRAQLMMDHKSLTEVWLYRWTA